MSWRNRFLIHGLMASVALAFVYFGIVSLAQSFSHAVEEFAGLWYLMIPLMAGFGTQVGLFSYLRSRFKAARVRAVTSASGTVSTVSMIACCAHHLTDLLALIGIAGLSLFLSQYYVFFIWLGVVSNLVGISITLDLMQRRKLYSESGFFNRFFSHDMRKLRNFMIILLVVTLPLVLIVVNPTSPQTSVGETRPLILPTLTDDQGALTFSVRPVDFSFDNEVTFEIKMDTHSGSLDLDLTRISYLDDGERIYSPISWEGSPTDGHHREGFLKFPRLPANSSYMKLTIENAYDVPKREFTWTLRQ